MPVPLLPTEVNQSKQRNNTRIASPKVGKPPWAHRCDRQKRTGTEACATEDSRTTGARLSHAIIVHSASSETNSGDFPSPRFSGLDESGRDGFGVSTTGRSSPLLQAVE